MLTLSKLAVGAAFVLGFGSAQATLIDFVFTITKPLMHGSDVLGGSVTPIVFQFRIDADAPNINAPSPTDGIYPINDHGVAGFGKVSIGSEIAFLEGGLIQIGDSPTDRLVAITNGPDDGTTLGGRSLFVSFAHLFDISGQMFTDTALPLDTDFASHATGGFFQLIFRPTPSDPEFLLGGDVRYDTFIAQGDFSVTRAVVNDIPEPTALTLVALGLAVLRIGRRKKA